MTAMLPANAGQVGTGDRGGSFGTDVGLDRVGRSAHDGGATPGGAGLGASLCTRVGRPCAFSEYCLRNGAGKADSTSAAQRSNVGRSVTYSGVSYASEAAWKAGARAGSLSAPPESAAMAGADTCPATGSDRTLITGSRAPVTGVWP